MSKSDRMKANKAAQNTVIQGIVSKVERAMHQNEGKIPYRFVAREVASAKISFPNLKINRDHINYVLQKRKKEQNKALQSIPSTSPTLTQPPIPKVAGRPTGTTEKRKRSECLNERAAKNEICKIYHDEKEQHRAGHANAIKVANFPTGCLD